MSERKSILITGAAGFIGAHLVSAAAKQGFDVYAMVRKNNQVKHLGHVTYVLGDVTDKESLKRAFSELVKKNVNIDYVIHAAALTKALSKENFYKTNVAGTQNLIEALTSEDLAPKKIIFLSSLAASGPAAIGGMVRTGDQRPITLYGKSKLQAEPLIINSGFPYVIIRPTAVYGPGEKDLLTVFKFINRGINPLLGNLPQELTFIYVEDLVQLIIHATRDEVVNQVYFAGDGRVYSRQELTAAISQALRKDPFNLVVPLPLVKVAAFFTQTINAAFKTTGALNLDKYNELVAQSWNCDTEKTFLDLNYTVQHDLYTGAKKTVDWYKKNNWIK